MRFLRVILPPIVVFVLVAVLTEVFVRWRAIPTFRFPLPSAVFETIVERREILFDSMWNTAKAALAGFGLSAIIGIAVAMLLSTARLIERAFYPYTVFFQTVPIIAIAPMLVLWFDFGLKAIAVAAFIASVFPVIANTLSGLLGADPALRDLFKLYGAGHVSTMVKLKLPGALPNIFTGLRIAAGLAVIGAIVGEFVAGELSEGAGLGVQVIVFNKRANTAGVFAAVLLASLLGLAMLATINLVSYLVLRRWHASEQNR
jgi:NitT/TauT family transport system permease protein